MFNLSIKAYWSCFGSKLDDESKKSRMEHYLTIVTPKYFSQFNQILENKIGKYLVGESVTFADIRLVNHIEFFSEMTEANLIELYTHLQELVKYINDMHRIKRWKSKRPLSSVRKEEMEYDAFFKA